LVDPEKYPEPANVNRAFLFYVPDRGRFKVYFSQFLKTRTKK
jgi:hypothetical protein